MTAADGFPAVWANLVSRWVNADAESAEFPEITPRSRSLLQQLDPVVLVNDIAVLTAPSKWVCTEIEKKMSDEISEVLERETGTPITLSLSIKEPVADPEPPAPISPDSDAPGGVPVDADAPVPGVETFSTMMPGTAQTPDLWENMSDAAFPHHPTVPDPGARVAVAENPVPAPAALAVPAAPAAATHGDDENRLNPKYTFDTFVTGPSNQFPAAACRAVAENPGKAYNPLFIYGQPGLGKTHLLHAIGHYARELKPDIRVRYVSSEEMTNEFINAIQGGPLALDQFKRNYRNLDLLIVDDIQFLQGKESTQEEFFHTFNALYQANHQIVLSSDRPPSQLTTLEDRLRTRFEGGLTTDVKTPDLETRMAILAKKSLLNGAAVPRDVLEFIASRNESSIRELEGALTRVVAYCSMTGEPITIAAAEVVVKDILPQDVKITPDMVIEVISDHFNVSLDQLTGPSKVRKIVTARQFGMFLTREYCEMSTTNIGKVYGGRDHTTVMHAEKKMRRSIQENTMTFEQFQELTQKIKSRARQH